MEYILWYRYIWLENFEQYNSVLLKGLIFELSNRCMAMTLTIRSVFFLLEYLFYQKNA